MDIQTSDGKGMLLRYAASYVSKWHHAFNSDAMFSIRTGPYQAAYRQCLESDIECAIDERNVQSLPSTSGHDWRKFLLV